MAWVAGRRIGLSKLLLNPRKSGTFAWPFCSWNDGVLTSSVALAVIAIAGAKMTNRAKPGACGHRRDPRLLDTKPETEIPERATVRNGEADVS